MRRRVIAVGAVVLLMGLGACSDGGLTEAPEMLASQVATEMEKYGLTGHSVDCGEKRIPIVVGETITCTMTVADDPMIYDVFIKITSSDTITYTYEYSIEERR